MQSVIGEGWRRLAIYLPLSSSVLQNDWSIVFKTSLLFWVALMRSRGSQNAGHYLPSNFTDLHWYSAYPCLSVLSVGVFVPTDFTGLHWYSAYLCSSVLVRGRNISPCPAGRNLNYLNFSPWARNVLFCAQQVVGFMLFKLLLPYLRFSWDSLDFLSPFGRTIVSRA